MVVSIIGAGRSPNPKLLLGMVVVIFIVMLFLMFLISGNYSSITIIEILSAAFIFLITALVYFKKKVLLYTIFLFFGVVFFTLGLAGLSSSINGALCAVFLIVDCGPPFPPYFTVIGVIFIVVSEIVRRKGHITKEQIFSKPGQSQKSNSNVADQSQQ